MLEQAARWANTHQVSLGTAVPASGDARRHALLAELAFSAAEQGYQEWVETPQGRRFQPVSAFLSRLPGGQASQVEPSWLEWNEIDKLARVLVRYIGALPASPVFRPPIPGCGVLDGERADMRLGTHLIEVKSVTRPFGVADFRQVLAYVAMLASIDDAIDTITLLNGRRARYVTMTVEHVAQIARGESAVLMIADLVEAMSGMQISA
jgi:hypothetical protein